MIEVSFPPFEPLSKLITLNTEPISHFSFFLCWMNSNQNLDIIHTHVDSSETRSNQLSKFLESSLVHKKKVIAKRNFVF